MQSVQNPKPFEDLKNLLPQTTQLLDEMKNQTVSYVDCLKEETFVRQENETDEEAIHRIEGMLDRLDEMNRRNKMVVETGKKTVEVLDKTAVGIDQVIKSCEQDGIYLEQKHH